MTIKRSRILSISAAHVSIRVGVAIGDLSHSISLYYFASFSPSVAMVGYH
jgi:hypothetical protein